MSPNLFFPLNILDMEVYNNSKTDLNRVKEVRILKHNFDILTDIKKNSIAFFIVEMLTKLIREQEANKELFSFLRESIFTLNELKSGVSDFHLIFLFKLSEYLGFRPQNNFSDEFAFFSPADGLFKNVRKNNYPDKELSKSISEILKCSYSDDLNLNREKRQNILTSLIDFYNYHLHNIQGINSKEYFRELFD